ncbi:MAG: DUF2326 domain-containing protein [bacterium]|nr:DUF2326 domain-containing protein [bacterium]
MKISQIYSNKEDVFPTLKFNAGLNVIYAKVTRPKESDKDSHNLGKTLLIHLIDFLLLKGWSKRHFLYDNRSIFSEFVFFIELHLNSGHYVTLRRSVSRNSKICINEHRAKHRDFRDLEPAEWQHAEIAFEKAKSLLDDYLDLTALRPWPYRKGVGYFLRTQNDYRDVFQLQRFSRGKDSEWKPYLSDILGFDSDPIKEKYEIDNEIEEEKAYRSRSQRRLKTGVDSYDRIKGLREIKRSESEEAKAEIDRFNFYKSDMEYNSELVDEIEKDIAILNDRLYTIDYELSKILDALDTKTIFDLDRVEKLFNETGIAFPGALKRTYGELLSFNQRLTNERTRRLLELQKKLVEERKQVDGKLAELNKRREGLMSVLQETETFQKFRSLQKTLASREAEIARLDAELAQLDEAARIAKKIQHLNQQREEVAEKIQDEIMAGNARYAAIRQRFNRIVHTVIRRHAIISASVNTKGNLEFAAGIQEPDSMNLTSEDKGTSYRKLLCAAFDMALLLAYENESFYRFVYHDGVLEALDNRKKRAFLEVIRDLCDRHGMQYILTLIDADIPRDENDQRIPFLEGEIIRELFEGSDEGRLFRMPSF